MTSRVVLFALVLPFAAHAAAQAPRDRAQPVPANTGRIAGTVISAGREPRPVRRARVTINGSALQTGRTAITGDDGAFAFDALPQGEYTIAVVKSGYITTAYGASGPGRPGLPVVLGRGTQRTITISVARGGAITGMLTDAEGQPLPGLQVRALTYRITPPGGERRLIPVQHAPVVTDDRGVYRVFGLPAGEYAVAVSLRSRFDAQAGGLRTVSPAEVRQALSEVRRTRDRRPAAPSAPTPSALPEEPARAVSLAPVFFPGTTSAARARLLTLAPGEERTGVDVQVDYVPVARIAGTVVAGTGGGTRASVRLVQDPHETLVEGSGFRGVTTEPDGGFAFDYVPPGRYVIAARASADGAMPLRYDPAASLWASTEIVVDGQDIPNVVLTPTPGLTIEGRIVFEGQRPPPRLSELRMIGLPLWSRTLPGGQPAMAVSADGRFTIPSVPPGLYMPEFTIGIRAPIGAWWLKSISIGGREVLDAPLELRDTTNAVTVTFADTASELRGRVAGRGGEPASNHVVVVFPVERSAWFFNSRRIAAVRVDAQGEYVVRNLPPGDYLVVARSDLDPLEWFNPDTLEKLTASATAVRIRPDEQLAVDITVPQQAPK
jgi:hypothetical protein